MWWENSPLTVLEARAAGVPVVASAIGGVPEVVAPDASRLVPAGDPEALAAVLEDVLAGGLFAGAVAPSPPRTVADEAEAVSTAKRYLSYFQGTLDDWDCADQRRLRHLLPENRRPRSSTTSRKTS